MIKENIIYIILLYPNYNTFKTDQTGTLRKYFVFLLQWILWHIPGTSQRLPMSPSPAAWWTSSTPSEVCRVLRVHRDDRELLLEHSHRKFVDLPTKNGDLPTKNDDFVHSYVSLPEAIWLVVTGTMEFYMFPCIGKNSNPNWLSYFSEG